MKKIYQRLLVLSVALLLIASDGFCQTPILYIGRDALGDYQSDQDMVDSLTAWGYAPEYWGSAEYQLGVGFTYDGFEGIVFSESVDSKMVGAFGSADDYPLPAVNMEGYAVATNSGDDARWAWLNDNATELMQTDEYAGTADELILIIKDNSHYITEVFNIGDEIPWSSATVAATVELIRPVSIKQANVTFSSKLGQMKSHAASADFWNLLAVDAVGASNNKLVYWGVSHMGLNGDPTTESLGTSEYFTILRRSVEWAIDDAGEPNSVEQPSLNTLELVAFPNPATEQVTIRFRAEAQFNSTARLYNMAGQQVDMFNKLTVPGNNFFFLDADSYPAGIYHLRLDLGGETSVAKVVIQ